MRYFDSSRPFEISLGLSILLHLCLFLYFYYYHPESFKKVENLPISVEYLSPPKEEVKVEKPSFGGNKRGPVVKLKAGKPRARVAKDIHKPIPAVKPAESTPPVAGRDTKATPEPHPIEVPKTPSLPGIKDLTPSLDQLTKTGVEKGENGEKGEEGEGGKDEETLSLDSTDIKYESYLYGVRLKIEGVWKYPEAAKRSALRGRGLLSFTIQRDGTLSDLTLLTSSGYPILDEAILKAIRDAAPFNPMLDNMPVKRLNIVATFEYNLVVQRIWGR
ncbi:MAG: energy transducer TonB [Deltaproteobacteria bacterium]|nr:energy transducer TonB [Deltaproteobacteria bacterium]